MVNKVFPFCLHDIRNKIAINVMLFFLQKSWKVLIFSMFSFCSNGAFLSKFDSNINNYQSQCLPVFSSAIFNVFQTLQTTNKISNQIHYSFNSKCSKKSA